MDDDVSNMSEPNDVISNLQLDIVEAHQEIILPNKSDGFCLSKPKRKSSGTNYICKICSYSTNYKGHFVRHLTRHDIGVKNLHKCEQCAYETPYSHSIKRHMLVHENPEVINYFECSRCDYKTKYKNALSKHEDSHKDFSEVKTYFQCKTCAYKTLYKNNLTKHNLTHNKPNKKLCCNKCTFKSFYESNLREHKKIHDNPGPIHNCDKCTFTTPYKFRLKKHNLIHTNSKQFECDKCTFTTIHKHVLKEHKSTHNKPEIYECPSCDFKGKTKNAFVKHQAGHGKNEITQWHHCVEYDCDYRTIYKHNLKDHYLQTHFKKPDMFKCANCLFKTRIKSKLIRHLDEGYCKLDDEVLIEGNEDLDADYVLNLQEEKIDDKEDINMGKIDTSEEI